MTATSIIVRNNTTTVNGGGIYNEGTSSIKDTTISDNSAEGGGGVFLTGSNTVTITGSTLSGNSAVGGGGISGRAGMTLNMVNSTISGNTAADVGAGLYSNGSAVLNFVTIAKIVSGSDSATQGSGINMFPASTMDNTLSMKNVLLADNMAGSDPALLVSANCGTTGGGIPVTSLGNNLSSDASCDAWLVAATDLKSVDPIIGDLAPNGGPTLTHALVAGSPALSAGASDAAVTTDQRGQPRETPPDIGAFELDNITESTGGGGGGGCAVGGDGRLDPTMPAMLAAALAFFGLRRRAGK
jgi:MYXO-CTERM domain-containing protein